MLTYSCSDDSEAKRTGHYNIRTHCPACATLYVRYARVCKSCGRRRDQKSAEEVATERADLLQRRQDESDQHRRIVRSIAIVQPSYML